jgi:undecaprenyl-diphosphatase
MSLLEAILMGIIQGLTEFLPVSSSGHLAIFRELFKINLDSEILFDVILHIGSLIAVTVIYHKDIRKLFLASIRICMDAIFNLVTLIHNKLKRDDMPYRTVISNAYRKFTILVIVATVPTAIIGYAARSLIAVVSKILIVPGVCLIITSIILFIADQYHLGRKTPKQISYNNAFIIGICQGIATLPGISRSGITITACLVSGFDKKFAVKYSFILSIPVILGVIILDIKGMGVLASNPTQIVFYCIGGVIAGMISFISIKMMLVVVKKRKFKFFAIYCLLMGVVACGGYFFTL